jgi:uncharacterized protein (DUF427 family)
MKVQALYKGELIAESEKTIQIEGNHYFPAEDVRSEYLKSSETHTFCPWKGKASYYHIAVNGDVNEDAAWYYPEPKSAAEGIKNYVAFWRGVEVKEI